jgi:amino acid transporter/mannitol/fructose-specific phosphotransferase system IIA component (Ntr-type)
MSKTKKPLGMLEVFCIASGAMISSGLFVLPSIVYSIAGPGIIISYIIAGILVIPAMLSKAELGTAMPKAGGTYFFVGRSLGPLMGSFAGLANWFSISLKGAFALIGMGAFVKIIYPDTTIIHIKLAAIVFVLIFTLINIISTKHSGHAQDFMVFALIGILIFYIFTGFGKIEYSNFVPFIPKGKMSILATAGMVFISYGGLTKIASLAGEINNPGKTLPAGMFLSFIVVNVLYIFSIILTIGILSGEVLSNTYTPISLAAEAVSGKTGLILLSVGAIFSFATTANASILSASRIPLAMAEDKLLPGKIAAKTARHGIPWFSILMTSLFMIIVITTLDLKSLVKTASTMMLILFTLVNFSVILMRESKIVSYRPKYKSPFYPYIQVIGIIAYLTLIAGMGEMPLLITGGFFLLTSLWFAFYTKDAGLRDSALIRIVERVISKDFTGPKLHEELTEILFERDDIQEDRFDKLIREAVIIDIKEEVTVEDLFNKIAAAFAIKVKTPYNVLLEKLWKREESSTTALDPRLAIPHIVLEDGDDFHIVVVRVQKGVWFSDETPAIKTVFSLAGDKDERNFHLKALMAIAQIVQSDNFEERWETALNEEELRHIILLSERKR